MKLKFIQSIWTDAKKLGIILHGFYQRLTGTISPVVAAVVP